MALVEEKVKRVGGERNAHGTRLTRRIVCMQCSQADYIAVHTNKEGLTLCKACAQQKLNRYEVGVSFRDENVKQPCTRCKRIVECPKFVAERADFLCKDCMHGFDIWRGSINADAHDRKSFSIQVGRGGILLRRTNKNK